MYASEASSGRADLKVVESKALPSLLGDLDVGLDILSEAINMLESTNDRLGLFRDVPPGVGSATQPAPGGVLQALSDRANGLRERALRIRAAVELQTSRLA